MLWNKKVLLRERKRHTASRVASTPSVVLAWRSTPSQVGYPHPDLAAGVPDHRRGCLRVSPQKGHGTSGSIMGRRWGNPPPRVWTDKQTETIAVPHPSDAGGNNVRNVNGLNFVSLKADQPGDVSQCTLWLG